MLSDFSGTGEQRVRDTEKAFVYNLNTFYHFFSLFIQFTLVLVSTQRENCTEKEGERYGSPPIPFLALAFSYDFPWNCFLASSYFWCRSLCEFCYVFQTIHTWPDEGFSTFPYVCLYIGAMNKFRKMPREQQRIKKSKKKLYKKKQRNSFSLSLSFPLYSKLIGYIFVTNYIGNEHKLFGLNFEL